MYIQVEAAYDMLLMQSLSQRRAGKVVNSSIRYADVKPVNTSQMGSMPQWVQGALKNPPVSVESPSARDLGIEAGVYGALAVLTYVNGASSPVGSLSGSDVPGLILATSFGASLYFMTKRNVKLGKATVITIGGLVAGAVVGSAVENWLQVDIVPFLGIHSPATVETTDKVVQIKKILKAARDRQKSYADNRRKPLDFSVEITDPYFTFSIVGGLSA
nr:protein chaperone-like protein of POR1, chloroplastic [Tanacetum cinerariifolium]